MKLRLLLAASLFSVSAQSQSVTIYLCNDCTYESVKDHETITFRTDGRVQINHKPALQFSCSNNDGIIELRYKGKVVNHLNWYEAQDKGFTLIDDRHIGYNLVDCTGNMPSMAELNNPQQQKRTKKK